MGMVNTPSNMANYAPERDLTWSAKSIRMH